jgi:hypothetical protein
VRSNISMFARLAEEEIRTGVAQLESDLASGAWQRRFGDLLEQDEHDAGYRLFVAELGDG